MVFTPEPTIVCGGYFYSYHTMHLTEFALVSDLGLGCDGKKKNANEATNGLQPAMLRRIYRMVLALPSFARTSR